MKEAAANYTLDWVGSVPAKRESRRFVGAHVMKQTEIQDRLLYPDRIAFGGWIIDDHTKGGILARDEGPNPHGHVSLTPYLVPPYSVTLRSLYANEVENLYFAGRVMSASRLVFNSLRVQRTLAVIGQAAGTAAAHSAAVARTPAKLDQPDIHQIQQSLLRQDCYIPRVRNEDANDLARGASVTASSAAPLAATPLKTGATLDREYAQILPLVESPKSVRVYVQNESAAERSLRGTLHGADDIWDLPPLNDARSRSREDFGLCARVEWTIPASRVGAIEGDVVGDVNESGLYWLRLEPASGVTWLHAEPLPGYTSAKREPDGWQLVKGSRAFAADVLPLSRPFEPANVVNGVARPETWPNVWRSEDGLPQWCKLDLPEAATLGRIQVTWGWDLCRTWLGTGPFFRDPECARDYRIEVELEGGSTVLWVNVEGNYQRLRVHERPDDLEGKARAIRITIETTNGAPRAEIAEVRAYRA